jgi:hypothetical protein
MLTMTAHLIFVFFNAELPHIIYRGNTALLSTIVTSLFAFSASRLARWRA